VAFVSLSNLDLRSNIRRNLFLISFHAFKSVILLLEQVHQIRQDFVRLWRRREWNVSVRGGDGGRGTSSVRGRGGGRSGVSIVAEGQASIVASRIGIVPSWRI